MAWVDIACSVKQRMTDSRGGMSPPVLGDAGRLHNGGENSGDRLSKGAQSIQVFELPRETLAMLRLPVVVVYG